VCWTWRFCVWPSRLSLPWPPRHGSWRSRLCAVGVDLVEVEGMAGVVVLGLVVALGTVEGSEKGVDSAGV
jgi:hypothetical protein